MAVTHVDYRSLHVDRLLYLMKRNYSEYKYRKLLFKVMAK